MIIIVDDNYNNTVCTCKLEIKRFQFVILISNGHFTRKIELTN